MAASGVWGTCGAPHHSGDGWRGWYSWPGGDFTPAPPSVRTTAGQPLKVVPGPWQPGPPPPGSKRHMAVQELRVENATPGALYEVTIPEAGRALLWRTLPQQLPPEGVSLLIGSCFWLNDDRDAFSRAAVKSFLQRERPLFKVLM